MGNNLLPVSKVLSIWVIYENPTDFPGQYVARKFLNEEPTLEYVLSKDLEEIREKMRGMELFPIRRHPSDDPVIVETWV